MLNIYLQSITLDYIQNLGFFGLSNEPDPIESIVNKYKVHSSIKKIKKKYITVNPMTSYSWGSARWYFYITLYKVMLQTFS